MSASRSTLQAEYLAVGIAASSTSWIRPRPWIVAWQFSLRVSVHLTGTPSCLASDERDRLLGVHVELGAEAAADVGRDDSQLVLRDAGRQRDEYLHEVRHLGRRPHRVFVGGRQSARRHERGSIALGISRWLMNRRFNTTSARS